MVLSHGRLRYVPQAAIKSGLSSTGAIDARFGIVSNHSNLPTLAPPRCCSVDRAIYKTSDYDGFDAQSVALAADYNLANGINFGAIFNVGSGEVDGESKQAQ